MNSARSVGEAGTGADPVSGRSGGRAGAGTGAAAGCDQEPPDAMDDPESAARAICLRQLDRGPRTRAELAERLRRRGVPDEPAERVLDRLADVGLVDDTAYADAWVSTRQAGHGFGRRRLAAELRRKGVARDTVTEAVGRVDAATERATARALVTRRLPQLAGLPRQTQLRRLAAMLARRGYPEGLVREVVADAVLGSGGDP
jgi:regulatory protein